MKQTQSEKGKVAMRCLYCVVRCDTIGPVSSYLPGADAGAESEARSEIPLASIMVSLLVAVRASLVTVCRRADEVLRSSLIMFP